MDGVQAESLSMPGGRHLKENLYSFDGATDICVCGFVHSHVSVCVCVCVSLFVCVCVPPLNVWLIH